MCLRINFITFCSLATNLDTHTSIEEKEDRGCEFEKKQVVGLGVRCRVGSTGRKQEVEMV